MQPAAWILLALVSTCGCLVRETVAGPSTVRADPSLPSQDEVERRLRLLEKEAQRRPKDPEPVYRQGRIYEAYGRLDAAQSCYERVLALTPPGRYTGPHYELGRVYAMRDLFGPAEEQFQACLAIPPSGPDGLRSNPHYRDAWFILGHIYSFRGQPEQAASCYRQYLDLGGSPEAVAPLFGGLDVDGRAAATEAQGPTAAPATTTPAE
ncbi:MAG: tetratricopeptide repeat protein [Planctomycetes bacterium]|nr:tetratricopeptide repeat protein [Planctomycetota bacterium]